MRRIGRVVARLAVAGFALVAIASFVPVWPCSMLEHFRIQYVLGGLAVIGAAAAGARRGWLDVAAIAWLLELIAIAPDLSSRARAVPEGHALRVLLLNVHTSSTSYERVRALIRDTRADVVALVETNQRWLDELAPAVADYPSQLANPRGDNFGVAIYARRPLAARIETLGTDLPTIVARLALDDGDAELGLVLTHPLPPVRAPLVDDQARHFDAIAARTAGAWPLLVLGDFNATPWSRAYHRLRRGTGLCDTRAGFGAQTSFPADRWLVRIPIDHVLASCAIGVRDRRIGADVGSDHLPVILDLVIP